MIAENLGSGVVDGWLGKKTRNVEARYTECVIAGNTAEEGGE